MNPLYKNDPPGSLPNSWYMASAELAPLRPALRGQHRADVCVIGAGFTGLTAALRLAERGLSVIVLDAHRVGFGASGRNGGQVGSGYNWTQVELIRKLGETKSRALWECTEEAKSDLQELLRAHAPSARYTPGVADGVYRESEKVDAFKAAEYVANTYGYQNYQCLEKSDFADLVRSPQYCGGVLDMGAGHIHPLRYVLGLARAAETLGVTIHEQSEVHHIAHGTPATVRCGRGHVTADHVIIAGNGYLPNLEMKIAARVMPINSFICATEPLGDKADEVLSKDIAVADSRFVVNYYRLSEDRRLLFGGRENYALGYPTNISGALVSRLEKLFPQLKGTAIEYSWGGTLGITMSRLPAVQRIAPNVVSAGGYSGHGVALSGFCGKVMAEAVAGTAERFDLLGQLPTPAFPGGPAMRAPLLTLAMTWYSLRDKLGI